MGFKVHLIYFRSTGRYLAHAEAFIGHDALEDILDEIHELRRIGRMPGLKVNSGRDLVVLVDIPDHPERTLYLALPPSIEDEDCTPIRVPTGEMVPLIRLPMEAMPTVSRTTTKDLRRPDTDDEDTPVDGIRLPGLAKP